MNFNNSTYKTYKTNGRVSIYTQPTVNITNTGKINPNSLGVGSINVLMITGNTINFDFSFDYKNKINKDNTIGYRYEIFKYNPLVKAFNQKVYKSETFNLKDGFGQEFPTENLHPDGDYLIKSYFTYKDDKLFKNIIFSDGNGDTGKFKNRDYDDGLDNYFVAIKPSEKPTLFSNGNTSSEKDVIKGITIEPLGGEDSFVIGEKINGEIIVTFNGLVLSKKHDFTFKNNILYLNDKCRKGDIINIFYTSKGEVLTVEVIDLVDITKEKRVNFNKEKGRFELYINKGLRGNKEIISLNGLVLTPDLDYVRSISDDKRIIFMGDIKNGDIINVVYTPKLSLIGNTYNIKPSIGWYLKSNPINMVGRFILELSKDENFKSIIYEKEVPYISNISVYKVDLDFELESFVNYFYRVKNVKSHKTINQSTIELESISDEYSFKIINNKINSY